jgi:hypothetical protein
MGFEFEVGETLKDKVTGYEGICVSRSEYLTGCNRYALQSSKLIEGKPSDWHHFDEHQLEKVNKKKLEIKPAQGKEKGGWKPSSRTRN